jgi:hypothetical protein
LEHPLVVEAAMKSLSTQPYRRFGVWDSPFNERQMLFLSTCF